MALEIFGVICGFVYLFLEITQKKGMWIIGLLMAAVYAAVYWQQEVYASMSFQVYYILVSVYGYFMWKKLPADSNETNQIFYRKLTLKAAVLSLLAYIAVTVSLVWILDRFTDDPMPFADSSVMVLSAIATFWLSKSYREQWLIWLLVNIVTVAMTLKLHLYPTALLYFVNAVASVYGYLHWKKKGVELISH